MSRYIDADELRDEVDSTLNWNTNNEYNMYSDVMNMIDNAPTEDVQPVIHAEWELVNEDENVYMCSNCGDEFITIDGTATENHMLYCPFCGAKMDKKEATYIKDIFMTR